MEMCDDEIKEKFIEHGLKIDDLIEIPEENSLWRHKSGLSYRVIVVSNLKADRQDEYPITITYRRCMDNTVWSRPLSKWYGSFTQIPGINIKELIGFLEDV